MSKYFRGLIGYSWIADHLPLQVIPDLF